MPPLSWNEIKSRAVAFSRRWADEASEQAEAKTFWNEFFHVFGIDRRRVASFEQQVKKRLNAPLSSSMGRLFDAVASLLGICHEVSYEGQAAIELETLSQPFMASAAAYAINWEDMRSALGISLRPLLQAVIDDVRAGTPVGLIGARFHRAIARLAVALCEQARRTAGLHEAALSGGVWQNQLLRHLVCAGLAEAGFIVYVHRQVPANDGGLALGQAALSQDYVGSCDAYLLGDKNCQ